MTVILVFGGLLAILTYILYTVITHCNIGLRLAEELGEEKEAEFEFVRACKLMPKENFMFACCCMLGILVGMWHVGCFEFLP